MDKMDLSLDTIIEMNKSVQGAAKGAGGGKSRKRRSYPGHHGGGPVAGTGADTDSQGFEDPVRGAGASAQHLAAARLRRSAPGPRVDSNKILVSNLADTVSDDDVAELFSEFGKVRYSALHHDAGGRR